MRKDLHAYAGKSPLAAPKNPEGIKDAEFGHTHILVLLLLA